MDATHKLKEEAQRLATENPNFKLIEKPYYNIDDMDPAQYMWDRNLSGCYVFTCVKQVDPQCPGEVIINGEPTGAPILGTNMWGSGQNIGVFVRKHLREYGKTYEIRYTGAKAADGTDLGEFVLHLTTFPKVEPGQQYPDHDRLALQAAREGMVLLRNENEALPLGKNAVINAFGAGCCSFRLGCVGAGKINPRYGIRFEEGIEKYSSLQLNRKLLEFYRDERDILPPEELLDEAKAKSGTAVVVLTRGTGESMDNPLCKGGYYLSDEERALLQGVRENFQKVVVLLNTGYPIEMGWEREMNIDAVLWTGLCGMAGGRALAEILEGTVSPSGRLPDTWTFDYYDIPASANFYLPETSVRSRPDVNNRHITLVYEEDLYVGYRYFSTFHKPVAYPFGHGLSYTSFRKTLVSVSQRDAQVKIQVRVTNTGNMDGKETVLIFAKIPDGKLEQPSRRLVAFEKTDTLAPGASETLTFTIDPVCFDSYDEDRAAWIIEQGMYHLYLGGSVEEAQKCFTFPIEKEILLKQVENRVTPPIEIQRMSKFTPAWPQGKESGYEETNVLTHHRPRKPTLEKQPLTAKKPVERITFPMLVRDPSLTEAFVAQLTDYELCRFAVGAGAGWGAEGTGVAGYFYNKGCMEKYQIPEYGFSDGNNGLNIREPNLGFPVSNVMCATFNEELSYQEGRAIAKEARDRGIRCLLAPAMNLHRNPLCGRHSEYFSEDPYLAGRMGGQEGRGMESVGVSSCYKHFFANNAETLRQDSHSIMTERAARELYLRVFETAFEVNMPDTMMTGYNIANGEWCAGDEELLVGILREEWNFQGFVMTDWGSAFRMPAERAAQAGVAWSAPGSLEDTEVLPMVEALKTGALDRNRLQRDVCNMFLVLQKYYVAEKAKT